MTKNRPVDILFLTHRYKIAGGAEKALIEMLEYLHSIGLKLHVIVGSTGNFIDELDRIGIPHSITYLPYWAHSSKDPSPFQFTSLNPTVNPTLQLVELIREIKPKLCVSNTIVVPWLGYASSLTGTNHAWMIHELGSAGLNLRYAIGEDQTLRTIDNLSDVIFFNSHYTASYYLPSLSANMETGVVYPGGSLPKPDKLISPYRANTYKLVAVAQLKHQKGQMDAVQAVKKLRDEGKTVQLVLVGYEEEPDYCKEIKSYIHEHKLSSQIQLVGLQKNPASYVALADAALTCSTNDAFGRVTVEAMMLGKPVIAAASAGTLEIIDDGHTGLLYKPADVDDLVEKIKTLMDNTSLSKKLATSGKKFALATYTDRARYADFLGYYRNLPRKKRAIDLTPLGSSFIDFENTIKLLNDKSRRLDHIEHSRAWRVMSSIKRLVRR